MAENDQERTEQATDQRREDFRKRGQVAQTRELGTVFALFLSALMFYSMGPYFLEQFNSLFRMSFGQFLLDAAKNGDYMPAIMFAVQKGAMVAAPFAGILMIAGI